MSHKVWVYAIGGVIFAGVLWWTYNNNAGAPLRELRTELQKKRAELDERMDSIRAVRGADRELKSIGSNALGNSAEQAMHALRVALNTIAHEGGLTEISVDSRDAGAVRSPAERSRSFRDASQRDAPDFHVIEGSLRGTTTLENAMRVLARVQSQGWPKQVVSVSLSPRDDGSRVEMSVSLRTAFLNGFEAAGGGVVGEGEPGLLVRGERIAQGRVFSAWTPPVAAAAPTPAPVPEPAKPRKPAWDQWAVTGLVEGREGVSLLLINRKNGENKTLRVGDELLGLVFEGVREGSALIRDEGGVFAVFPGQDLASRDRPITDL